MIIITRINWSLLNDNKKVISKENVECDYIENLQLNYREDNTLNTIDFKNKLYLRENEEFLFKIDFKNKIFKYILKENDIVLENEIECYFEKNDNFIELKYKLDEEEKKIVIQIL